MKVLHIDCSPRPESHSRPLSAAIVRKLLEAAPRRNHQPARLWRRSSVARRARLRDRAVVAGHVGGSAERRAGSFRSAYSGTGDGRCGRYRNAHAQLNHSLGPQGVDRPNPARRSHLRVDAGGEGGIAPRSSGVYRHRFRWSLYRRESQPARFSHAVFVGCTVQFLPVQATAGDRATLAREKALAVLDLTVMGEVPCPIA
jgi:FMN-dependent NADH-azoreductase